MLTKVDNSYIRRAISIVTSVIYQLYRSVHYLILFFKY